MPDTQPIFNTTLESESTLQLQADRNTVNRFVVFLDIMGFKDRVARTSHSKLLTQLTEFNSEISSYISFRHEADIQLAQFSDSIILFSNDTTLKSLKSIADFAESIPFTERPNKEPHDERRYANHSREG